MNASTLRLITRACDASDELHLVGHVWCSEGRWIVSNRAGVVVGRGDTPVAACQDYLIDSEVIW